MRDVKEDVPVMLVGVKGIHTHTDPPPPPTTPPLSILHCRRPDASRSQ